MSPAISFSEEKIKEAIFERRKNQTIRERRIEPGARLKFFWKQRTKNNKCLGYGICTECFPIRITNWGVQVKQGKRWGCMPIAQEIQLINRDGFSVATDFFKFFRRTYGLPKEMNVIIWKWLSDEEGKEIWAKKPSTEYSQLPY